MPDLIEKIGRFFAEQEAQIQETFTQATHASARVPPSRPPPPVHRIPTHPKAQKQSVFDPVRKSSRGSSLVRRRLSANSTAEPTSTSQASQCLQEHIAQILDAVKDKDPSKNRGVPFSLRSSVPLPPSKSTEDVWSHRLSGDLVSWASPPPDSIDSSRRSSVNDEDLVPDVTDRQRKPRPPQQKHRKRSRKKKRSGNQEEDRPDPKAVAKAVEKAKFEKVAAALMLAQDRAKRFQQEQQQLEREQELERQEAAFRLQEQMVKIEAVRARSFRSSTMNTARSSLSNIETESNNHDVESVWTADTSDMEFHKTKSQFMTELEAQLRDKMSLEMHLKQSCIEKHKQRERVRLKLDKVLQEKATLSAKVARLSAMKASLEMELAAVLEDTAQTRQQRRELELADEKERLKRQREAERELQIRLREEEWNNMMEEEKARSQVAAEARAKASKRVEAHSAKLRKMMQAYRHHSSSNGISSSSRINNNDSDHSDDEKDFRSSTDDLSNNPPQPFKMDFFLPPELADFEEDGLCTNNECKMSNNNDISDEFVTKPSTSSPEEGDLSFKWQVPSFPDTAKFNEILLEMVSDDEDE